MSDLDKALELAFKGFKKKPQKPKLTPDQLEQLLKVFLQVQGVLNGGSTIEDLDKENKKMLAKMAKTFIEDAAKKAAESTNIKSQKDSNKNEAASGGHFGKSTD